MRRLIILSCFLVAALAHSQVTYWRWDGSLQNSSGQAIGGAKVYVYDQSTGALATLYANNTGAALPVNCGVLSGVGNQINNPITTNGYGEVCAYLPANCFTMTYVSATTGTRTYTDQGPGCLGSGTFVPISGGSMTGTLTNTFGFVGPLNTVQYPTTFAALQSGVSGCASLTCTIVVNTTLTVGSNYTIPTYVALQINNGAQLQPSTGVTLTINGPIQAPTAQIFGGTGSVVLGPVTSVAPFEWFGAKGDASGSAGNGTDNTATMQACLTALTNGQCMLLNQKYRITSALSITKSNVGIGGVSTGLTSPTLYAAPLPSAIIIDSASADAIDVSGTDLSHQITSNRFSWFQISRTQAPGVAAAGMRIQYSSMMTIDSVVGQDHTACFFFHGVGSIGIGYVDNSGCEWGYQGFTETSGSLGGFQVDSTGGVTNNSLRIRNSFAASNLGYSNTSAWTTYGLNISGTATHDFHGFHIETANTDYGVFIDGNSAGFFSASDIFLNDGVNDGNWRSSMLIRNVDGSVTVNGGWNTSNFGGASAPVVDIESSHHVVISANKVVLNGNATAGIAANNSNGVMLSANDFVSVTGGFPAVTFGTTTQSVISANAMNGGNWGTDVIKLFNASASNTIAGNSIQGTATNGINIDSTSVGIAGLESNTVGNPSFGTITNLVNDPSQNGTTVAESLRVGDAKIPSSGIVRFFALAAVSGSNCLQIDNGGTVTNTGAPCGSGSGSVTTTGTPASGQSAYFSGSSSITGIAPVAITYTGATAQPNNCYNEAGTALPPLGAGTPTTHTMTGLTTSMAPHAAPNTDPNTIVGSGRIGGMQLYVWASAANTFSDEFCNLTASSITFGTITFNVEP